MPHKDKETRNKYCAAWRERNREKLREYHRDRYHNDPEYRAKKAAGIAARRAKPDYPEKSRASHRRWHLVKLNRLYKMPVGGYEEMHANQHGLCCICHNPSDKRWLHVDHDHKTHEARGLLCDRCNRGLGYFADDPDRLKAAAKYLEDFYRPSLVSTAAA